MSDGEKLGIVGAGRLGRAIAERWQAIDEQRVHLWSRRFEPLTPRADGDEPFRVASIESVFSAGIVVAAIPSAALAALAEQHPAIAGFAGVLLITGIDRPLQAIERVMPSALAVRVTPSLLSAPGSISFLVHERGDMDARWERARSILASLGTLHHVDDERAFESIMYLTSPFPVVLRRAMTDALAGVLSRRGVDGRWRPVAERVLWDALLALASAPGAVDSNVTTPGGVTAAGLQEVGGLAGAAEELLLVMMRHGERLSDSKG